MSGASTLRNAVKRVTHKERAQPSDRKKFGLLEKHKDYVERATDYKKKQKYLTTLRRKAADKNPDEFYMHMNRSKVQNGVHRDLVNNSLDHESVNLLKTQDLGYIIYKKAIDQKKIEKLKESVQFVGGVKPKHHAVFVDDEEEFEGFDPEKHFNTPAEFLKRTHNRLRNDQLDQITKEKPEVADALLNHISTLATESASTKKKKQPKELKEIREREKRARKLNEAMEELSLQRNLARSKGPRQKVVVTKTVGDSKKPKDVVIYKWLRKRSR
jgi:U3 small nucleolar RNA-associated protein 11